MLRGRRTCILAIFPCPSLPSQPWPTSTRSTRSSRMGANTSTIWARFSCDAHGSVALLHARGRLRGGLRCRRRRWRRCALGRAGRVGWNGSLGARPQPEEREQCAHDKLEGGGKASHVDAVGEHAAAKHGEQVRAPGEEGERCAERERRARREEDLPRLVVERRPKAEALGRMRNGALPDERCVAVALKPSRAPEHAFLEHVRRPVERAQCRARLLAQLRALLLGILEHKLGHDGDRRDAGARFGNHERALQRHHQHDSHPAEERGGHHS
mmetsp:Transcript_4808/g.14848  ORF Transcript_4808/g.14848 Transcript_4808/m.14848 type:complete len:270 (-) Transcript_4808:34-843(-)